MDFYGCFTLQERKGRKGGRKGMEEKRRDGMDEMRWGSTV